MLNEQLINSVISILRPHYPSRISIFGSYARGEGNSRSDLDILIHFKIQIGLIRLVQIQQELSDKLGVQVDLVTENNLKNPRLKKSVQQDLITIYNEEGQPALS